MTSTFFRSLYCLFVLISLQLFNTATAMDEFLTVDEAFQTEIQVEKGAIRVKWAVTPQHYLYGHTLALELEESVDVILSEPDISPRGKEKYDEFMGDVIVHEQDTTLTRRYSASQDQEVTIIAQFQGCAAAGLCYPPKKYKQTLTLPAFKGSQPEPNTVEPLLTEAATAPASQSQIKERALWQNLTIFFGLGLLLSLTPCVLPMVPILSSIILGTNKAELSAKRGFSLSTSYVLGMASIYTLAGLLVALSGSRLQIYLQHPYVLWTLASVFVILAVSLFGAFELRLPSVVHNKLHDIQTKLPGGQLLGVFLIGAMSAVVVSPCVSAPLAGILLYIAQEGDALTGGLSLFFLAMGMGAPLIVLGTTGANVLPRAGGWMDSVKAFFGFMMLAMAVYLVKHLIDPLWLSLILAAGLAFFGVWLGALHQTTFQSPLHHSLGKALGLVFLMLAGVFTYQGSLQIFPPQGASTATLKTPMAQVVSLEELDIELAKAKAAGKHAMVDVYADWCVACIEFEVKTFPVPEVQTLLDKMYLIKLDITDDLNTNAILDTLEVIGPPTLIFYNKQGKELRDLRVTGFLGPKEFAPKLAAVLQQ